MAYRRFFAPPTECEREYHAQSWRITLGGGDAPEMLARWSRGEVALVGSVFVAAGSALVGVAMMLAFMLVG